MELCTEKGQKSIMKLVQFKQPKQKAQGGKLIYTELHLVKISPCDLLGIPEGKEP